jgi:DNA-binding CsgD family transcriptional regulator/tetratricopeptide (TPR) repeat protein
MLDRLDRLPAPQREALRTAFGLSPGEAPDRFLVGLAVLSLLAEVAEERPLVCVVDDAQWLDLASAQALAFVARRLLAESVALVFAVREPSEEPELRGLPEIVVKGLRDDDARALLRSVIRGRLDERVLDRLVAETRGNPLALLELPRGLTSAQLAGGFGLLDTLALSGRIEESFLRRLEGLPEDSRRLLLIAAAERVGEPATIWGAAERLGITADAAAAAVECGVVEFGARVRFRHPLVRSAVYGAASAQERRGVHDALAQATDPEFDPDQRAWHRAHAAASPDDEVADELEHSAGRAQARGGVAAAAAFLERAAGLTLDAPARARRALAAAEAKHQAGAPDAALALLDSAEAGPLDELQQVRVQLLRARIAFAANRGGDVPGLLVTAAKRLERLDLALARETYLDAVLAAIIIGRLASDGGLMAVAQAARGAPPSPSPPRPRDLLLEGIALLVTEGYAVGAPVLRRALQALRDEELHSEEGRRWLGLACRVAMDLWDDESWHVLSARAVALAREAGALTMMPNALVVHAGVRIVAGEFDAADGLSDDALIICDALENPSVNYVLMALAGWRGDQTAMAEPLEAGARAVEGGEGRAHGAADYAVAVLCNGLGHYQDALAAAQRAVEYRDLGFATLTLPELVEAAVRWGEPQIAAAGLQRIGELARASGTDWALGMHARSQALLSEGPAADNLYREAIERLTRTRARAELARAHLLYGEWLRRESRRIDARDQLRTAHDMLTAMGARAFAARAGRELLATGETVRKRKLATTDQLTPQEAQIARLARDGHSNPEIGSQLFISPRTVEYHLSKVFSKLDINSRSQLQDVLAADPVAS